MPIKVLQRICLGKNIIKTENLKQLFRSRTHFINTKIMSEDRETPVGLPLSTIVSELTKFADLSLAEKWDNVGLLIEPYTTTKVKKILLTNDLTEVVMEESIEKKINLIISYHPPIFSALKRITKASWKERLVAACLENRIALFSPHTSWDAVLGGVNDWLADAFANYIQSNGRFPIKASPTPDNKYIAVVMGPSSLINILTKDLRYSFVSSREKHGVDSCTIVCSKEDLQTLKSMDDLCIHSVQCETMRNTTSGMGRLLSVTGLNIEDCVKLVKNQVGLPFVRLALAKNKTEKSEVQSIALCAGSGASLLKGIKADLFVTGEMLHHDVLDANHNGTSVILTNHSDSERGFLSRMEKLLNDTFCGKVNIQISVCDSDPLKTV